MATLPLFAGTALIALALASPRAALSQSVPRQARDAYVQLTQAYAALRLDHYDAAIAGFTRALELVPTRNDVRKNLAYTFFKIGRNDLAKEQFADIVRRDSTDETAEIELAFLSFESLQPSDKAIAFRLFDRLSHAKDPAIRSRAAATFANIDTSVALRMADLSKAMRVEPENNLMSAKFARAAEERGMAALAEEYYRGSATSESMGDWFAAARLARAAGRVRDAEAAEQHILDGRNPFLAERVREDRARRRGDVPPTVAPPEPLPPLPVLGYAVVGANASPWADVLHAGGFAREARGDARLYVIRPESANSAARWQAAVKAGAFVILEGASPTATAFGFVAGGDSVDVGVELDVHSELQTILWEHPTRLPRVSTPAAATVFTRDRWTNAPLVAGYRVGKGGVLWVATVPGTKGFERLPYLLRALTDLGVAPSVRGREIQVLMDWSYRTRADPEYLAKQWRAMGVGVVHVSAWYFFERDVARDTTLGALIDAAHRNGIIVYAWFQFPHVSNRFWADHPEWREKNALLQDAEIYWRKNMNLGNPATFKAVANGVTDMMTRFKFDGATISEMYFEGPDGLANLGEVSPLNDDVRGEVKERYGFDPADLFDQNSPRYYARNPTGLAEFEDYRVDLQYRLHIQLLDLFASLRSSRGSLGISVIYLDDIFVPSMRQLIGADARRILKLIPEYDFTFILEDASRLWGLGPDRYGAMADQYAAITSNSARLAVDINIVARPSISFPTNQQTGTEFLQLVHVAQRSFRSVMLYSENSILPPDIPLLASAAALVTSMSIGHDRIGVNSRYGVGVRWTGPALVDGAPWPYTDGSFVWVPAGQHEITRPGRASDDVVRTHLVDFNGEINTATATTRGLVLTYKAEARAIAILDRTPVTMRIDGVVTTMKTLQRPDATVVLLPAGSHKVEFVTQ
jgi:Tfp pilus assembly protein PilF